MNAITPTAIEYSEVMAVFWYVIFGFLSAFGLLCGIWVLIGLLMPRKTVCDVMISCGRGDEIAVIRRFCFFRELGFTHARLTILHSRLNDHQKRYIRRRYPYIQFCADPTEEGRECVCHGAGDGDPAGNHRCGDFSEL